MNKHWVAAWGASPNFAVTVPATYAKDITLRYTLRMGIPGEALRLTFSNFAGEEEICISRVTIMHELENGKTSAPVCELNQPVHIAPHSEFMTEPLPVEVRAGKNIVVSLYLGELTPLTTGVNCTDLLVDCFYAQNDWCDAAQIPVERRMKFSTYYYLTRLDVLADESCHALVAFGDSITARPWPEYLALRLGEMGNESLSVVRRGISGSRVLRRYTTYELLKYGLSGVERFERELTVPGVDRVIVLHGINDIIHPNGVDAVRPMSDLPTAQQLIDGLRRYIEIAHSHGVKIYLATIMPFKGWHTYGPEREAIRTEVNCWIRTSGEADGFVDFASAACAADDESMLDARYDSSDHLHPSPIGSKAMAMSIPEEILKI